MSADRKAVVFDGGCGLCRDSARLLRAFDLLRRLEWIDMTDWKGVAARFPRLVRTRCAERIHVVLPDGRVLEGFRAVRSILASLPLLWPLVPLLHLPGAAPVGGRLYDTVAARRHGRICRRPEAR